MLGSAGLPGRARSLHPPLDTPAWQALLDHWRDTLGPFDDLALYHRTQPGRTGFLALLLHRGRPTAFLKVRDAADPDLEHERRAVDAMARLAGSAPFHVPPVLTLTRCEGLATLAFEPLPAHRHVPPRRPPIEDVVGAIQEGLAVLPRPDGTPAHWRPFHGDLAPWNLREHRSGRLILVDWEGAGWAPPGADHVFYAASARAVLGARSWVTMPAREEARAYWSEVLRKRGDTRRDARLAAAMAAALETR